MYAEVDQYSYHILKSWMILNLHILISNILIQISVTTCCCIIRHILCNYLSKKIFIFDTLGSKHFAKNDTVESSRNFQEPTQ